MNSSKENDVWELVEHPSGRKTVRSKWVYKTKIGGVTKKDWLHRVTHKSMEQIMTKCFDQS